MIESPIDGPGNEVDRESPAAGSSFFDREGVVTAALAAYEGQQETAHPAEEGGAGRDHATTAALEGVANELRTLASGQNVLRELFESRIRSDETQAKTLERLHDQVLEYKSNFVRQEMQPLLRDLIYCYDFAADEMERAGRQGSAPSAPDTAKAFDHLRQMIADVLAKYDIEPYRVSGDSFDRKEQQCVRTVPTTVMADEKKIASVGAIGFRRADMIVRKEQVIVYKYTPDASTSAQPAPTASIS